MSLAITPLEIGSRPVNGSSYMIISGSMTIARASAARRAMPPDNSDGMRWRAPRKPTVSSFMITTLRRIGSGSWVCSRIGNATFSNTLRSVNSAPVWNSSAMRLRSSKSRSLLRSGTDWPSTMTWPESGLRRPPMRLSNVVLPQPLPPMMAVTLPRRMESDNPRNTSRPPSARRTSRISTRMSLLELPDGDCVTPKFLSRLLLKPSWPVPGLTEGTF